MTVKKQKPKGSVNIDGVECELNEDGLPIGLPLDFATLQKHLAEQRNGTAKTEEDDES